MIGVLGSWLILHRLWITLPMAIAVALWWGLFLVVVPSAYKASLQQDLMGRRP
jgi:predicted benzoate:H+ symporter BenE